MDCPYVAAAALALCGIWYAGKRAMLTYVYTSSDFHSLLAENWDSN